MFARAALLLSVAGCDQERVLVVLALYWFVTSVVMLFERIPRKQVALAGSSERP